MMNMEVIALSFFAVLLLSGIFALLGLGGASIYVPVFFWLGIPLESAIAAGLFMNVVSTGISSLNYHAGDLLDFRAAFWILAGALIGSPIGVWLSHSLPHKAIIGLFSLVLLLAALRMAFAKIKTKRKDGALEEGGAGLFEELGASVLGVSIARSAAGGTTGIVSGTLGIGGGVFLVPFLMETGFSPKKAAVLSTFVVFFASLVGLLGHVVVQQPDYPFMLATGSAALIGAYFGSKRMAEGKIPDELVKRAFALLLFIFGLKLAYDFFI